MASRACVLPLLTGIAASSGNAGDEPYFRKVTPPPGYVGAGPWGISADGRVVVGDSAVEDGFLNWHAFRWDAENGMQILGSLYQELNSTALAASSDGSVVVGVSAIDGGTHEAFRWTEQQGMTGLGDLPGGDYYSRALGIAADGRVIVGRSAVIGSATHAFRWTEQTGMLDLGTLPGGPTSAANAISADGLVIVGIALNADYKAEAFRWTEQEGMRGLGDLPGDGFYSTAYAVSADGSVIVGRGSSDLGAEAFRWTETEGMIGLGFLGRYSSVAYGVSGDGSVVVGEATDVQNRPFIWTAEDGMRNLQDIIQFELGLDLLDFDELIGARGISADGRTIIGYGFNDDGQIDGWVLYLGPGCRADFDHNDTVDTRDVTVYLDMWVQESILADWNYDATVDIRDVIAFLNAWVTGC